MPKFLTFAVLFVLCGCTLSAQTATPTPTPVKTFAAIGVTLTPDMQKRPAVTFAHKITDAGGEWWNFTDYTLMSITTKPQLSMEAVPMTGFITPLKYIGPEKWRVRLWGGGQIGVAATSSATGLAIGAPFVVTIPVKNWFTVVAAAKPVKTTLSAWQADYRLSIGKGW